MSNIKTLEELVEIRNELKKQNKKVVFTNGCFDLIHAGHIDYLTKAKTFGDILIVALNSDASVKRIKGAKRPIVPFKERSFVIANIKAVDFVTQFEEDTPFETIKRLIPDILIKGADWKIDDIVGKVIVEDAGGKVETIEFVNFQSTTNIINSILERFKE
ncbi:MAG: D-glycero-beta-D-manno-heptose 1-phosphate adenylyltransferase [Melioribacteraceae bacterium]|jgi:rfaE bifunctional protein nucleotidyltransferase chain/domain|nr:D-glycero-beta-D-manno-heptose 1-phosphate adenylyltransferase [Melioribacteraceae bacterium]